MKYKLKGYNIYELGQRKNQEDFIFPAYGEMTDADRLFILCDGMGGHEAGEVASQTVCQAISSTVFAISPDAEGRFSDAVFQQALKSAFDALDVKNDGAGQRDKKMGTTMTFLKLHDEGATIAHIGDSRVYHIRPGKDPQTTEILFQTEDHSLVNDLVRIGELSREEAKHSPQKNVITRAMQPDMARRPKADIYHTCDILPGDYFMMCSDGILEQMEDDNLKYIFSNTVGGANKKVEMLKQVTADNNDNHSAILVHILEVEDSPDTDGMIPVFKETEKVEPVEASEEISSAREVVSAFSEASPKVGKEEKTTSKSSVMRYVLLFFFFAVVCFAGYWFFRMRG